MVWMLPDIYNTSLLLTCPVNLACLLIGRFSMSLVSASKNCLRVISQSPPIMEVGMNSMQLYLMDAIFHLLNELFHCQMLSCKRLRLSAFLYQCSSPSRTARFNTNQGSCSRSRLLFQISRTYQLLWIGARDLISVLLVVGILSPSLQSVTPTFLFFF